MKLPDQAAGGIRAPALAFHAQTIAVAARTAAADALIATGRAAPAGEPRLVAR